jgi:hypothetical protein
VLPTKPLRIMSACWLVQQTLHPLSMHTCRLTALEIRHVLCELQIDDRIRQEVAG